MQTFLDGIPFHLDVGSLVVLRGYAGGEAGGSLRIVIAYPLGECFGIAFHTLLGSYHGESMLSGCRGDIHCDVRTNSALTLSNRCTVDTHLITDVARQALALTVLSGQCEGHLSRKTVFVEVHGEIAHGTHEGRPLHILKGGESGELVLVIGTVVAHIANQVSFTGGRIHLIDSIIIILTVAAGPIDVTGLHVAAGRLKEVANSGHACRANHRGLTGLLVQCVEVSAHTDGIENALLIGCYGHHALGQFGNELRGVGTLDGVVE